MSFARKYKIIRLDVEEISNGLVFLSKLHFFSNKFSLANTAQRVTPFILIAQLSIKYHCLMVDVFQEYELASETS